MFKLGLSAGHSNETKRGVPASLSPENHPNEWVLNDRVATYLQEELSVYTDCEVKRLDTKDYHTYNAERAQTANAWGADLYLAIHHNAGINGGSGGGIVAYVQAMPTSEELDWQKRLYEGLIAATGLSGNRASPLARSDLDECRLPEMPSVLLELGFMDSRTDIPVILTEEYARSCAKAIAGVIAEKAGLQKAEPEPEPAPAPDPEPTPDPDPEPVEPVFPVGSKVIFAGDTHYKSANAAEGSACHGGLATITQVYTGLHPYHLVRDASPCTVYGWVDAEDVYLLGDINQDGRLNSSDARQILQQSAT